MSVPTITSKEIALAEYPTHSKYFKSTGAVKTAVEQLSKRKAKKLVLTTSV